MARNNLYCCVSEGIFGKVTEGIFQTASHFKSYTSAKNSPGQFHPAGPMRVNYGVNFYGRCWKVVTDKFQVRAQAVSKVRRSLRKRFEGSVVRLKVELYNIYIYIVK